MQKLIFLGKSKKLTIVLLLGYLSILVALLVLSRFSLRLSYLVLLMFPFALIERRPLEFVYQWAPFYFVIFFYDLFRGIADDLAQSANLTFLPTLERGFFGGIIPTVWLQEKLSVMARSSFGVVLAFLYFGHFVLPVLILYLLWRKDLRIFRVSVTAISLVSVMGFITFLLFPAAPPWMASDVGVIPEVNRLIVFHLNRLFSSNTLPQLYFALSPNDVAPFPALHAAYPVTLFLLSYKYFPRFKWLLFTNALVVSFTVVLFAEHYVIDVIGGWFYAVVAFFVAKNLTNYKNRLVTKFTS